jgi:AcrR family transcriptional regulator
LYKKKMNETKEKILTIALYYFLKKPFTEVTMSEILRASGLSKGGFYHHFESKEILYKEVIDRFVIGTFMTEYGHYRANPYELPFCDFVPFYIKSTLDHLLELADTRLGETKLKLKDVNLYMVLFDIMKHYSGFDKILDELHQSEIEMFKILIDREKEKGAIRKEIDTLPIANQIHILMHGIFVLAIFDEGMDMLEDKIRRTFNDFYQFIKV